jgi:hypothetical protein
MNSFSALEYNVSGFGGTKSVVLATTSWLGTVLLHERQRRFI